MVVCVDGVVWNLEICGRGRCLGEGKISDHPEYFWAVLITCHVTYLLLTDRDNLSVVRRLQSMLMMPMTTSWGGDPHRSLNSIL